MTPALRVSNLSKRFRLVNGPRERNLQESLAHGLRSVWSRLCGRGLPSRDFWALQDVSFEVQPGEVLGIIGRNGAGKSTLLKILSRVTEPTSGFAEYRGRLGSLLEVGTGFHPELNGRENVFLNGSLLGMSRVEIQRKFDDIIAFAELSDFIDTPVKRYSSGMYVRLAFAIAAHLEPDILLFDEILAVGDATYQRRCIDRMGELAAEGHTILFVSHNMDLIPQLCQRALVLEHGRVITSGSARTVIDEYMRRQIEQTTTGDLSTKPRTGDGRARFTGLWHIDESGAPLGAHVCGDDLLFQIDVESKCEIRNAALVLVLFTLSGTRILSSWTRETGFQVHLRPGRQTFRCRFRDVRLRPGHRFTVQLWMADRSTIDSLEYAYVLDVTADEETMHFSTDALQGAVVCESDWMHTSP